MRHECQSKKHQFENFINGDFIVKTLILTLEKKSTETAFVIPNKKEIFIFHVVYKIPCFIECILRFLYEKIKRECGEACDRCTR